MTFWVVLTLSLLAVNLVRMTRRVVLVASVLFAAFGVVGVIQDHLHSQSWWRYALASLIGAAVVVLWGELVLDRRLRRQSIGILCCVSLSAMQPFLFPPVSCQLAGAWLWMSVFLMLAEPSTRILRLALRVLGKELPEGSSILGRGEVIGVLERWLVLVLIGRGDFTATGLIIAAKTLARHQRFERDPEFAEYFLVGTLASLLMAVAAAEFAQWC